MPGLFILKSRCSYFQNLTLYPQEIHVVLVPHAQSQQSPHGNDKYTQQVQQVQAFEGNIEPFLHRGQLPVLEAACEITTGLLSRGCWTVG